MNVYGFFINGNCLRMVVCFFVKGGVGRCWKLFYFFLGKGDGSKIVRFKVKELMRCEVCYFYYIMVVIKVIF